MLRPWLEIHLGEGTIRLLSVIPGIAAIPVMYLLARRLFGRGMGLLSTLLLTFSTCAVVYSQEARSYSWLLFGTIVSTYFFVRLIERPTIPTALLYGVTAGVTFYFHYFGLLVPLAQWVALIALPNARRPWRSLVLSGALMTLLAAPVLWMVHIQPGRHLDWVSRPSLLEFYHLGVFLAAESGKAVGPVLLLIELVAVVIFFCSMWARRRDHDGSELFPHALVASGLLTPIIFTLLFSLVRPIFFHRFLIICLPAWLLACAAGIFSLRERRLRLWAIAGVSLLSLASTVLSYSRMREDWRGTVNLLIDNARSHDVVVYYRGVGYFAAENYRDWLPGGGANRPAAVEVGAPGVDWRAKVSGAKRVWLVEYPSNVSDDTSRAVEAELYRGFSPARTESFRAVKVIEFVANR